MADTILLDIQIPQGDLDDTTKRIIALKNEIERLKKVNESVAKDQGKNSAAYIQNTAALQGLSSQLRENERILSANAKAQLSNKGTVEQLRAELSKVSVQWAQVTTAEGANSEQSQKLAARKLELTNTLKRLESQTGDTRRNVGNYSESMREALMSSTGLNKGILGLNQTMLANPALLVTTLLINLGKAVFSTQGAMDALDKVMQPLNAVFQRFIGILQELVFKQLGALKEALKDPKQLLKDIAEGAVQNLINRFTALGGIIKNLVKGDWAALGDSVLQLGTGVEGLTGKLKGTAEQMAEAAKVGARLAVLNKQIAISEGDVNRAVEEQNRIFAEQKSMVEDVTKSTDARAKAAQNALNAVKVIEAEQLRLLDLRIEKMRLEQSLNDTSIEQQNELKQLEAQRVKTQREAVDKSKEVRNQLNAVNKEAAAKAQAEAKAAQKAQEDEVKRIEAERIKAAAEALQADIELAADHASKRMALLKQQLLDEKITREQFNAEMFEIEAAAVEAEMGIRRQAGEEVVDLENRLLDLKIANKKVDEKTTVESEQAKKLTVEDALNAVGGIINEKSAAGKLLASAQTAISTYQAATSALKDPPIGVGPVFGPILAALTVAKGLANVARINAIQLPKFAGGVIGIDGPGTGTSDSIPAMISKGESVLTAKATSVFAPVLAQMEQAVGNRPNFQLGNRRFANGLIGMPANAQAMQTRSDAQRTERFVQDLSRLNVQVSVVEIDRVRTNRQRAESFAQVVE